MAESDILNGGLDWRVVPVGGARVNVDLQEVLEGKRFVRLRRNAKPRLWLRVSIRVWFASTRNSDFSGHMCADGVTTHSGARFQVLDPYDASKEFLATDNVIGTSAWTEQRLEFKTTADTHLLLMRIARPPSGKFDNKIAGIVWIDDDVP